MEGGKGERTMNRICSLAIGTVLMFSLATAAPQIAKTGTSAKGDKPAVEAQLKLLMHALDLTGEQQTRIEPVLEQLHEATIRLMHDGGLSREERLRRVTPARYQADGKIRAVLSEGQKAKLDQFEQEPHPEMHEGLN
jgi:Spy/CpxP family protein refolding chaperone